MDYRISLGVDINTEGLQSKINSAANDLKPITLDIELGDIKGELKSLNTQLKSIGASIGTLDSSGGMKNLLASINKIGDALEGVTAQFNNLGGKSGVKGAAQAAQQVARQTEKIISDSASRAIDKVSARGIGNKFKVYEDDSEEFNNQVKALVKQWTSGKGEIIDIAVEAQTRFDKKTNKRIKEIRSAQVKYRYGDVTEQRTIQRGIIGTYKDENGKDVNEYGFVEVHDKYRKSLNKTKAQTDTFVRQQKKSVSDLTNTINQLDRDARDKNASRPIKEQGHLDALANKYNEITAAIQRMGSASSSTFDDERNNVNKLISEYKSMKSEFKNAENVAGKLSGDDYESGKKIAAQRLGKLRVNSANYAEMTKTITELDDAMKKVSDASSLKDFNSQLKVAEARLGKIKAKANEANKSKNLSMDVSGLRSKIEDLPKINPDIEKFEANIDGAKVSVRSLLDELGQVKTKGDFSVVSHKFKEFEKAAKDAGVAVNDTAIKAKSVKDIQNKLSDIGFDGFGQEVARAHADVERLNTSSDELAFAMKRVDDALSSVQTANEAGDMKALVAANEEYEESLKRLYSQINLYRHAQNETFSRDNLELDKINALLKLESIFEQGSRAAEKFGSKMEKLKTEISECANDADMKKLNKEIKIFDQQVKNSNLQTKTVGTRIKEQIQRYSQYFSVASVAMWVERGLTDMFEQVKLIDSAMTELKKVTNETDASYNQFLSHAASRSKELGTTIDGLVSSTADFARLGYSFEESQGLAEVANIYAVVGDEIEGVEGATSSLVSTLAAFKHEMNDMSDADFAMSIVDKFNEVSNNFAISSGGIGEALTRSASSLAAANNTLDESIALITAANEVTQNPEKVGNAFKTISMRIRGAKTELEEAGESIEGMADSTASLRAEMLALSGVDIMKDENTFKSTYQIMDELSQKWEGLSDIQQATIIELVAGKHQGNVFSSLMANFDTARRALETSATSSGSAMAEHAKWSESLEARLNKLKAAWQGFSQTFMDSDLLNSGITVITGLVDGLDGLVSSLGVFGAAGLGTGLVNILRHLKEFKNIRIFSALAPEFKSMKMLLKSLGYDIAAFIKTPAGIASAIGLITAAIGLGYNAFKNYKEEISQARQEVIDTSNEFLDAAGSFEKAYIKYSGKTDLTSEEEAELASAIQGTVDALGDKSSALQSIANSSNDYLSSLEAIKDAELDATKRAAQNKKDNAELELKDAVKGWMSGDGSEVDIQIPSAEKAALKIAEEMNSEFFSSKTAGGSGRGRRVVIKGFELSADADTSEILDYYNTLLEYQEKLSNADLIDSKAYNKVTNIIGKMSEFVKVYTEGTYDLAKAQYQLREGIPKTTEEYIKMREAILGSDDIKNLSVDTKKTIANSLDSEYKQAFDLTTAQVQARKLIGILDEYGDSEASQMETFLNIRTAVNNNDCTIGQYLSQFDDINKMTRGWSDEAKEELNLAFGLDVDTIKAQYDDVYNYLSRNYLNKDTRSMDRDEEYDYKFKVRNVYKPQIEKYLNGLTKDKLFALNDIKVEIDWENASIEYIDKQIEKRVKINDALNFKANIEIDTASLETLNTALSESASAIGLTSESISALESKYSDLEGYDSSALFEATANGVKVNREEVAKLEKEYNDLNKSKVKEHLNTLVDEYNRVTKEIDKYGNASERARLISERSTYLSKIKELAQYQAQLEGVTGAYQRWIDAQNTSEDYEGYEAIANGWKTVQDEIKRGFLGNASKEYIDLLSGKDLRGADIDTYAAAWDALDDKITSTGYSIKDFFTLDGDGNITATGIDRFFEGLRSDFEGIYDEATGIYDFSEKNIQAIQDKWNIGAEAIGLMLEAAAAAGYNIDWDGILDGIDLDTSNFETLVQYAEAAQEAFNKLEGLDDVDFNFETTNVEDATSELEKAQSIYNDLITNDDGSINLDADGAEEMRTVLAALTLQKQELERPAIMDIKVPFKEAESSIGKAIIAVQNLQNNLWELENSVYNPSINSAEVQAEIGNIINELNILEQSDPEIYTKIGLDEPQIANLKTAISNIQANIKAGIEPSQEDLAVIQSTIQNIDANAAVNYLSEEQEPPKDELAKVNYELGTQAKPEDKSAKVNYKLGTQAKPLTMNAIVNYVPEADGTANVNGTTSGRAFAHGNWSIQGSGTALGGELGMETLVRDGHFYTIGDNGAEFFKYKQGDIIFNHKQTEELFKNGKVTSNGGRGKMFANGSAFAGGSYPSNGRAFWKSSAFTSAFAADRIEKKTTTTTTTTEIPTMRNWEATASESELAKKRKDGLEPINNEPTSDDSKKDKNEFEETLDWIETAIDRIERAIDKLDQKANNVYKSWSERNTALTDQISKVGDEIELQQKAYDRYLQEANSVGLSEEYASKVRDGTIDIEAITDEGLAEKIKDYQTWYEKALDCKDTIEELKETEAEIYQQRFENVSAQYDGILGVIEHEKNMLEEYINQSETQGWLVSYDYYRALSSNEKKNIAELENQKADMLAELQAAMESGAIEQGSEAWYEYINAIDEVSLSIAEANTRVMEISQTAQQLKWEQFDLLKDRISSITEETEFLIELLSSDKLYDDNGQLTDSGMATMGQHGVAYNTYMQQADQARAEAERIKAEMESGLYGGTDKYDTELEERYREMISLQQEHILAAQGEKEAIRDMVEEGIQLELDALQERIDKYNEALDSERDLYEYQKKVKEQTEEIASLEKQMAAYYGDDSEEAKQKVQKLKADLKIAREELKETEYDRYISDQQQMLDELYTEYEEVLNTRLDNIDALISDMISEVNANASTISTTISEKAESVGYTLSDSMKTIWDSNTVSTTNVITTYGEKFSNAQTTTNNALNTINTNLQNMIAQLNSIAKTNVKSANTSSASNSAQANAAPKPTPAPAPETKPTSAATNSGKTEKEYYGVAIATIHGGYGWGHGADRVKRYKEKGFDPDKVQDIVNKLYNDGYIHSASWRGKYYSINDLTNYHYNKFANGVHNLNKDQMAWTQEGYKEEYVIRPSDGAILTPVARGDSVLNAQASSNIWDMANSPAEFIKDNLNLGNTSVPNNSNVYGNYTQHLDKVVFSFPNVKNYDEMLSSMQKDKNFERLISSMTVDRLAGKSALAKGKSIR